MEKILVINPGSTSTKIAVYEDDRQLFVNSIEHADEEIEKYDSKDIFATRDTHPENYLET